MSTIGGVKERYLRLAVAMLALIGAGIAAYLSYSKLSGTPPICTSNSCGIVQNSKWSTFAGIPVAVLGLATYLLIFSSTFIRHELARLIGTTMALIAVGFNAFLLYIQLEKIHHVCTWCVSNEIVSAILAPIAIVWLLVGSRSSDKSIQPHK